MTNTDIKRKILNSTNYRKEYHAGYSNFCGYHEHHYDNFYIKENCNGCDTVFVYFNGVEVAQLNSSDFWDIRKEYEEKQKQAFLKGA